MSIYEERLNRIMAAVALEPVDKVPVISGLSAVAAPMTNTKVSDFLKDMELNCTCNLKATDMLGNVDGVQATLASRKVFPLYGFPTSAYQVKISKTISCGR